METQSPPFLEAEKTLTKPDCDLWGEFQRPFPTNAWWTPACLEGGSNTIHPLPYHLKLYPDRISICYPDYIVSEIYVISAFMDHMNVGVKEILNGHRLVGFDDLSATFSWNTENNASAMECPVVQGMPYVSFFFENSTPVFYNVFTISEDFQGIFTGSIFRVPLNNGQIWMIYASRDITLQFNARPCSITATEPFSGVIRTALVPNPPEAARLLDQCRHIIPTGAKVIISIEDNRLTYEYHYKTRKMVELAFDRSLLMMALPHHVQMKSELSLPEEEIWYRSIKGPMRGVKGNVWTLSLDMIDIGWNSIQKIDSTKVEVVRGALYAEAAIMKQPHTDPYASGKRLAAIGRLAIIADELREDVIASNIRCRLKSYIEPWLKGTNSNALLYDPVWGGIISTEATKDKMADFGSGMYNDHHFQYGYFIYTAAVIGKVDSDWLQAYLDPILALVRDYSNPLRDDPYFPRVRHFDMYACHSWAGGLFVFADGKNQESSSEAIHSYYALAMLATVLDHRELRDLGLALYQLEILSTKNYWHISDNKNSIYPEPFCFNPTVGIVWSGKVDYSTWFGTKPEYINCIQMLPFLPLCELIFSPQWIARVLETIENRKDDSECEMGWRGFIWMAKAVIDKEAAWKGFAELDGEPDSGNSITNALYWIATRP